jgi:hypothetical protein
MTTTAWFHFIQKKDRKTPSTGTVRMPTPNNTELLFPSVCLWLELFL